jgi:hypothetical protein
MRNFFCSVIAFIRSIFTRNPSQLDLIFKEIKEEIAKEPISYKKDFARVIEDMGQDYSKRNYTAIRPHKDGPEAPEFTIRTRLSSSPNTIREHRLMSQYSKRALSETPANPYDERQGFFEPTFQVGDVVEWGSQSKGTFAYKQGIIIAVVPEGVEKWDVLKMHGLVSDEYGLDRIGKGGTRKHPSFLVEVEGVTGQKKIYHPRVADLSFPK